MATSDEEPDGTARIPSGPQVRLADSEILRDLGRRRPGWRARSIALRRSSGGGVQAPTDPAPAAIIATDQVSGLPGQALLSIMSAEPEWSGAVVLVVHAHPDDEVFATGATTLSAEGHGARVHLRLFTGGEGRECTRSPPALVAARRAREGRLVESRRLLGIADWAYLAEEGRWTDTPHHPERTIATAPPEDLTMPVAEAIESLRPDVVLTVGPDGLTGHPDHVACYSAVRQALTRTSHTPRMAWGAVLDRQAVRAGYRSAEVVLGRPVGSGRVHGVDLGRAPITVTGTAGSASRRRRALDVYVPGLGSADHASLDVGRIGSGDSELLRFVLDISGWDRDHYVPITS